MSGIELPGFAAPVADAQRCFRAVLDAMARPGSAWEIGIGLAGPPPLDAATAAVLLTLVDADAALWLDPAFGAASRWVAFHCGVNPVEDIGKASFVATPALPDLGLLETGSDEEPERGATVVLQVEAIGQGTPFRLRGPGLKSPVLFAAAGLPQTFVSLWRANHASFPRGIDMLVCSGTRIVALPRSLEIEEA